MNFNEANAVVHKVEDQWHYEPLTTRGWQPVTKEATGFVRAYEYCHPTRVEVITCTTGARSDYWTSSTGKTGYWSDLAMYLTAGEES